MIRIISVFVLLAAALDTLAAPGPTVVVSEVEENAQGKPVAVNGLVRSRSDVELPARTSGQLTWSLEEGTRVTEGMVIAEVNPRRLELSLAEQQLMAERASVNLAYLEGEVARLHQLEKNNLAAKTQLAEMTSRRDLAANDLNLARARIAQLENELEETRIVSPIAGVIVERRLDKGEYARAGDTVARIVDPAALEITAAVPVGNLNRIDLDEPVTVSLAEMQFETRLRAVVQAGDQSSQTFDVIVDIPADIAANLVAGQFVEARIPIKASRRLYVPRDAVVLRSDGSYVFRIDEDGEKTVAKRITVELGTGQGSMVSVTLGDGGLKTGDRVAVRGVESLQDGQEVNPVAS